LREAKLLTHPPKFAIDKLRLKASFTRKFLTATACQFFLTPRSSRFYSQ